MAAPLTPGVAWQRSGVPVAYEAAVRRMEARVAAILEGTATPLVWLVEHPPLITAGTSASYDDLRQPGRFPVHATGRGGQLTYHGPGQRVAYVMLDLRTRGQDLRRYVHDLEEWLIRTVARFEVEGGRREGRVGIWVETGQGHEAKIAAIGVRVRRWITFQRRRPQREPGARPLRGDRALRHQGARRHLARSLGRRRRHGGGRRRPPPDLRRSLRPSPSPEPAFDPI